MYSQKVDIARELTLQWPYLVCVISVVSGTLAGTSDDGTEATVSRTTLQLLTGARDPRGFLSHVTGKTQTTVATNMMGAAQEIKRTGQSASRTLAATVRSLKDTDDEAAVVDFVRKFIEEHFATFEHHESLPLFLHNFMVDQTEIVQGAHL